VRAVRISTYDMGRQPFGLASPAAWLREAGVQVTCADLSKERLPREAVRDASLVAFFLPMHTATRLALPVIDRVRGINPQARLAAYGLYSTLNAGLLRERGVPHILGGEFEAALTELALESPPPDVSSAEIPRLAFKVPVRDTLPPLAKYAALQVGDTRRVAGYTEASRGCKHRCRHCPIVPVYDGRFRVVGQDVVLGDIRAQVAAGATHITFGDPDFFNGVRHARELVTRVAEEFPGVTYDVTIKVEHLLQHADMLPLLRRTGCAFVTSAVEAVDDRVLAKLEKGHTRAGVERAVAMCRAADLVLAPTFVAFTPWTTLEGYLDLLQTIDRLDLVEHVASIQLAIRLLITDRSRLLELDDVRALVRDFDPVTLTHPWSHPDPRVDRLHDEVSRIVGVRLNAPRADVFASIWHAAHRHAGVAPPPRRTPDPLVARAAIPYLTEPWYC
jgi:radical SAM superfamily enzyme YgiQ (UPF0313 family)